MALIGACSLLAAQRPPNGSITGQVVDPDGAGLPGTLVTAIGAGVERTAMADGQGRFTLSGLPGGTYELSATLRAFCTETRPGVPVVDNESTPVDVKLYLSSAGWGELVPPWNLRQAYRTADVVAHLRVTRALGPGRWTIDGSTTVGLAYEAETLAIETNGEHVPENGPLQFVQYPAGSWSDGTRTECGTEAPLTVGDEYVALLAWSTAAGRYRYLGPDYMIPVREGRLSGVPWSRYDTPGLGDGIDVAAFFDVLRTIPTTLEPIDDPDAYAVYRGLLRGARFAGTTEPGRLVLVREATTDFRCVAWGPPMETDWRPVLEDFKQANARPRLLQSGHDIGIPYTIAPRTEFAAGLPFDYSSRFPDARGYVYVSAVGFDGTKRRALVFAGRHCGMMCGHQGFHLLEKGADGWHEVRVPGAQLCGMGF